MDLEKIVQIWLGWSPWARFMSCNMLTFAEIVPSLLAHLNVAHVALASHSGGDILTAAGCHIDRHQSPLEKITTTRFICCFV